MTRNTTVGTTYLIEPAGGEPFHISIGDVIGEWKLIEARTYPHDELMGSHAFSFKHEGDGTQICVYNFNTNKILVFCTGENARNLSCPNELHVFAYKDTNSQKLEG